MLTEKLNHFIENAERMTDSDFRRAVSEILALFHEHTTGELPAAAVAPAPFEAKPGTVQVELEDPKD